MSSAPLSVPGSASTECSPGREQPGQRPDPHREQGDQHHPEPPLGHRVERQRGAGRHLVERAAPLPGAPHAEPHADHRGQDRGGADEQQGRPHPVHQQLGDRHPVPQRDAEVAGGRVPQEREELLRQRLVEAVGPAERVQALLGREPAPAQGAGGVAGQHPEQEEADHQHEQQAAERTRQPAEQVPAVATMSGPVDRGRPSRGQGHSRSPAVDRRRIITTPPTATSATATPATPTMTAVSIPLSGCGVGRLDGRADVVTAPASAAGRTVR